MKTGIELYILCAGGHASVLIDILSRSSKKVEGIFDDNKQIVGKKISGTSIIGTLEDISGADLVVNATSIGMKDSQVDIPCSVDLLHSSQLVVDLIYHPLETRWISLAKQKGIDSYNGVSMLLFQAAEAFTLWTGEEAPISIMQEAITQELEKRTQN